MTRPGSPLQIEAPAKLNLWLRVLARETSGYHQIETLFARLGLHDTVIVELAEDGLSMTHDGDVGGAIGADNLVMRAARAFFDAADLEGGASIQLVKRIPVGAGLGGGSSDAAATLLALNRHNGAPLSTETLLSVGSRLGSDVPFFLCEAPAALAWGRGDRLLPMPLPESPVTALLALPPVEIDTAWAYGALADHMDNWGGAVRRPVETLGEWDSLVAEASNDFEDVVHATHPSLKELLAALARERPLLARMSGSGATHFALFRTDKAAARARDNVARTFPAVRFEICPVG